MGRAVHSGLPQPARDGRWPGSGATSSATYSVKARSNVLRRFILGGARRRAPSLTRRPRPARVPWDPRRPHGGRRRTLRRGLLPHCLQRAAALCRQRQNPRICCFEQRQKPREDHTDKRFCPRGRTLRRGPGLQRRPAPAAALQRVSAARLTAVTVRRGAFVHDGAAFAVPTLQAEGISLECESGRKTARTPWSNSSRQRTSQLVEEEELFIQECARSSGYCAQILQPVDGLGVLPNLDFGATCSGMPEEVELPICLPTVARRRELCMPLT